MPPTLPGSAEARNKFEDLSGVNSAAFSNPYDALIKTCHDDPVQIQSRYSIHRTTRNTQQRAQLLSPDSSGLILDQILRKIEDPVLEPGFVDPRNCLVFWVRPPPQVRSLVSQIQQKLRVPAPNLWLMPIERLHMTALEITHSLPTAADVAAITAQLQPVIQTLVNYPASHTTRLTKPLLSYDRAAIALSFLPAAGEGLHAASAPADRHTYHHLRRQLYALARSTDVVIESRYVVPSAHITLGRFLVQDDHDTPEKMESWIHAIGDINAWLQSEFWPHEQGEGEDVTIRDGGEWIVGYHQGLDLRQGRLWYGGGETIVVGKGAEDLQTEVSF